MSGPGYNGPPSESRRLRQEAALKDKHIAELELEQTLHDAELDAGTARAEQAEAALAKTVDALQDAVVTWEGSAAALGVVDAALAERDRMLRLAVEDSLPNFAMDDMEDCSLMASRLADLRARAKEGSGNE